MENWRESVIFDFIDVEKTDHAFQVILLAANALGFEFCTYGFSVPSKDGSPIIGALTNYPDAWERRYNEMGYLQSDPVVLHGYQSQTPFLWTDKAFIATPQLWDEAKSFGLKTGWSLSRRDKYGAFGLLGIARSTEKITKKELKEKQNQLCWLTEVMHSSFINLLNPYKYKNFLPILTAREIEVLKWTADGKSAQDIAQILSISKNTVDFHIKNVITKLNVPNKIAAVVCAIKLGLLYKNLY